MAWPLLLMWGGGLPGLQRGGWVAGPCEFGFSVMMRVVVLFFSAGRRGGCLSGRYSFCLWLLVTCPGEWAVWLPFPLIRCFFFFNVIDNVFMRLRCAGVLGLEGIESVF